MATLLFSSKAFFIGSSSTSLATVLETNSVYTYASVGASTDRYLFVSDPASDPIFSGNNTRGYLYVINQSSQVTQKYFGEISRLYKPSGKTVGLQFFTYPTGYIPGSGDRVTPTNSAILIDLGTAGFQSSLSYNTSSDPVSDFLNSLLSSAPADAINDLGTALEKGGIFNGTAGFDASGNVILNDGGGSTNYIIDSSISPSVLISAATTGSVIQVSSNLSDASGTVTAGSTSTSSYTEIPGFYGKLRIGADGSYVYIINNTLTSVQALRSTNETLTDTFTYKLSAGGTIDVASLAITIQGQNDTPVAVDDYNQAKESLLSDASGAYTGADPLGAKASGNVLKNDTDVDSGDTKSLTGSITITGSATGTTSGNATIGYTSGANINSLPVNTSYDAYILDASGAYIPIHESNGITIAKITRTSNGNPPTVVFSDPTNLTSGTVIYAKLNATNYIQAVTVTNITVATSNTIKVTGISGSIAIGMEANGTGLATAPKVTAITYDASGNLQTLTLSSSVSIAGSSLTFSSSKTIDASGISITGQYGILTLDATGHYVYTPFSNNDGLSDGENVTERFTYTVWDAAGAQDSGDLYINVLGSSINNPNAVTQAASATEKGGINNGSGGLDPSGSLLTGTTTPSGINTLTGIKTAQDSSTTIIDPSGSISAPSGIAYNTKISGLYGDLYVKSNGSYVYIVNNNLAEVQSLNYGAQIQDAFLYEISNGAGKDWATFAITIDGRNDNPVANSDVASAVETGGIGNSIKGLDPSGNLLNNDTDVDAGDSKSVIAASRGSLVDASASSVGGSEAAIVGIYGTLYVKGDGTYRYVLDNSNQDVESLDSSGTRTDNFAYRIRDASGATSDSTLVINIVGTTDTLLVSSISVNEASPWAVFIVSGAPDQPIKIDIAGDPSGATLNQDFGDPSGSGLEYLDASANWVPYTSLTSVPLDANGQLLVRAKILQDSNYEGAEHFSLRATTLDGNTSKGSGVIFDDGTGDYFANTNQTYTQSLPNGTLLDDDRQLAVSGAIFNEGSKYIFWRVSGILNSAGQQVRYVSYQGTNPSGAKILEDLSGVLEFRDLSGNWQGFDGSSSAFLDSSSELLVRQLIVNDSKAEDLETFQLVVNNSGNSSFSGNSFIIDDGSGILALLDSSGNPIDTSGNSTYTFIDSSGTKDLDATLTVTGATFNEASSFIQWTVSGAPDQRVLFSSLPYGLSSDALVGPSGDITAAHLQFFDASSNSWLPFDTSANAFLDTSGSLTLRTRILNDSINELEANEGFILSVKNTGGTDASAVSFLNDDASGIFLDPSGLLSTSSTPDDDRTLTVSGSTFNEASSFIQWTVSGAPDQRVLFSSLPYGLSSDALVGPSGDITAAHLQFFDASSNSWLPFDASANAFLDTSGSLTLRTRILNDSINELEANEGFILSVKNTGGTDASAVSFLNDDASGIFLDPSGLLSTSSTPDDDRTLSINNVSVNEASPFAVFTVTGAVGQEVFLSFADGSSMNAAISPRRALAELGAAPDLQYLNGNKWQTYSAGNPPVNSDPSGELVLRIAIDAEQETALDGPETFQLIATNGGGTPFSGTGTILDDGSGNYWIGDKRTPATPEQLEASGLSLDDNRTLRVTAYSPINEGSTYAMFTVIANPGQSLELDVGNTSTLLDVDATITGFSSEWSLDGTTWTKGSKVPSVPESGIIYVRVTITSETDGVYEGPEAFTEKATYNTGGPLWAIAIANINDNGTGDFYSGAFSGGEPEVHSGLPDDDRSVLSIPNVTVNEASPYVVFKVSASAGQAFTLAVSDGGTNFTGQNDNPDDRNHQQAVASLDYQNRLETYNGEFWDSYTPGSQVGIPNGGSMLLVRVPLINDTIYEGGHAFTLNATPPTGTAASGQAIIGDFGMGTIFNDSGGEDLNTPKDDDRQLKVDSPIVNEGSEHVVFHVTGIVGRVMLALQDIGSGSGFATLAKPDLQYWNGSDWVPYGNTELTPGSEFPTGTTLLVRVAISEEQDSEREDSERFTLQISGEGGPSSGTATIRDDGTGAIWLGNSLTPATAAQLTSAKIVLDDDFDLDGIKPTTEEALVTLAASQGLGGLPGDHNGDGIPDALQNALATLAWRRVEDFNAGNDGTLTEVKPIISLAVLSDASSNKVSDTLQLQNIRVVDYTDQTEFGSSSNTVAIDSVTGLRMVTLDDETVVTTPVDPIRFEVVPQAGLSQLNDVSAREGSQIRLFIDMQASGLDANAFNAYIKFVSQETITAAGSAVLHDLDGNAITKEGWYDFTQRTPGGDGARFVISKGKIEGIEMILTDNAFGDNSSLLNRIIDPGAPVLVADARFVPTADGEGIELVGTQGQTIWADFSAVLADARLQNGFNLLRVSPTGKQTPIGAIGATPESGFLGDTRVQLQVGDVVRFQQVSSNLAVNAQPCLRVKGDNQCLILTLDDDGNDQDSDDLVLKIKTSNIDPYPHTTQMARYQTSSAHAYLDLSWIGAEGVNLNLDLKTDAGNSNIIRLVKVDSDPSGNPLGTVGGLTPKAGTAFDAAVIKRLLPDNSFSQYGQRMGQTTFQLKGADAGIYAPVMIAESGAVYTFGAASSSDGRQHVKVLGANSFAFEDTPNDKADWDFNDAVVSFNIADPISPKLVLSPDTHGLTVVGGFASADGLWLDLRAIMADASKQNSFDLLKFDPSGNLIGQVGGVGATSHGIFMGSKELFLAAGETLRFAQNSDNDDSPNMVNDLRITQIGERFRVAIDDERGSGDGDYNDLVIDVDATPIEPCEEVIELADLQQRSSDGILDLSWIGDKGITLNISVMADSGNVNTLKFVKLDRDASGGYSVDGITAGNTEAFRSELREADNLTNFLAIAGGDDARKTATWQLDATDKGIYAAVLFTYDGNVLTFGNNTAIDGAQHLKVLGDNSFGFEDVLANQGSDFDFNDFVVRITPAE